MIELRRAGPGDVPLVAEVLEMASRGHLGSGAWDYMFPETAERSEALQALAGGIPSWCHHGLFRVASVDGQAAAALSAFEPASIGGTDLAESLGKIFGQLGFSAERMGSVGAPIAAYMACFPDMPDGVWIVENVGTRAEFRRRGLVAALLDQALKDGRKAGYPTAQISCLIGNDPAQRAYEQFGFKVVEERKSPDFEAQFGSPGFTRMTLGLNA